MNEISNKYFTPHHTCRVFEKLGICVDKECQNRHFKTAVLDHCWEFAEGKCPRFECPWPHIDEETLVKEAKQWFHVQQVVHSACFYFAKKGTCSEFDRGTCTKEHL